MCSPATCRTCRKTTWSGCGQHVSQVMGRVPAAQRCTCNRQAAAPEGRPARPGGWRALFRR